MRSNRVVVLVREQDEQLLLTRLSSVGCQGWRDVIEVRGRPDKAKLRSGRTGADDTEWLIEHWNDRRFSKVFFHEHLPVDAARLRDAEVRARQVSSFETLAREVIDELKRLRLHYLPHAEAQCAHSSIGHVSPQVWQQQFAELDAEWVGRGLLKQLRVVSSGELRSAFNVPSAETLGLRVVFAYVHDPEPGSSSNTVKDVLEHLYAADRIVCLDLGAENPFDKVVADAIYVFEDGLWSGVELVKRLQRLSARSKLGTRVHFRYAATSDIGLLAGRLLLARQGNVHISVTPSSPEYHYEFLGDAANLANALQGKSDEEIRRALDKNVRPLAFAASAVWSDREAEAQDVCKRVGEQLVRGYLAEKEGIAPEHVSPDVIDHWSLGAMGFASTIVFQTSVPKPVLPLFWLSGTVTLHGRTVKWRPLFWDVRRAGEIR